MKVNDTIHGFTVTQVRPADELKATLFEMEYKKTGTKLIWLKRDDRNKTFAITFKTIPSDDTGVFHILEHSVLNGSDKYPVKEPFVELLKGSLQTFLNAMTFPDKTMYPVSSRNNRDFLNLIDVYMDAVLHPLIYRNAGVFLQEGWHYELFEKDAEPQYKGVVFNEMKGVYSSVESVMGAEVNRLLFPDTCYGLESGGDPEHIPELTYEQFLDSHRKFYHPSNAKIFLDGDVDMDTVLKRLDEFLNSYEREIPDADIQYQKPVAYREIRTEYEISAGEDPKGKTQLAAGYVYGTFEEKEKQLAFEVLSEVLCGSNESPLKKAILDRELAEDIYFQSNDAVQQLSVMLAVRNTEESLVPEVVACIRETLSGLVRGGLDHKQLTAALNQLEFRLRERDYGTYPRGLVYGISMMDSWLYDGDPLLYLTYDGVFEMLHSRIETGYFEELIDTILLSNPHQGLVIVTPSATLGDEKRTAEAARLSAAKAGWNDEETERIIKMNDDLKIVQETDDTPEQLATLPMLSLSDISEKPEELPIKVSEVEGCKVLTHDVDTDGILYADLYFSAAGLSPEELAAASFLCSVLTEVDTEHYDTLELQNQIKASLGKLSFHPEIYEKDRNPNACAPYIVLSGSVLSAKRDELIRLAGEVVNHSLFTDKKQILNLLRQEKIQTEQDFVMSGHRYAMKRVEAYTTAEGAAGEYTGGLFSYRWMKETESGYKTRAKALAGQLESLARRIFTRDRLTVSVTGSPDMRFIKDLINIVPLTGEKVPEADIAPLGIQKEGFLIPAGVSFAVTGTNLASVNAAYSGRLRVASKLLSLSYLWNVIRVQGGAYGSGFLARPNGSVSFYSYRDPSASRSLEFYGRSDEFLREFADGDEDLTKFIIGTIAETEPLLSPRMTGKAAAVLHLSGRSYDDVCRTRDEILRTGKDDLRVIAATLKAVTDTNAVCVIGGRDKLEACGDKLEKIEEI